MSRQLGFGGPSGPVILVSLLILASAAVRVAAVKAVSDWSSGLITHYGGAQDGMDPHSPSFGTKDGACGYGAIPKDKYPYFSTAALSPSNKFYTSDALNGCGQCFQIQCADKRSGTCKTDSAGKPLSVMVMISDKCPECEADHIDVQSLTFAKLADPGIGRIDVQYRRVECTPPEDMKVSVMDFRGPGGWLRLNIDDTGGRAAVKAVAVKGSSGGWQQMTNSWGATWELPSAPAPPLSFQITGDDDQTVTADNVIKQAGGISGGAFADRATFSAGVQFSITDPAFGMVHSFDGPSDPMLITSSTPGNDIAGGAAGGGSNATTNATAKATATGGAPASESGANATAAAAANATGAAGGGACVDLPPPGSSSCQQQKDWGKCYEGWFTSAGYCAKTCGRCGPGAAAPAPGCSDVPTPDNNTCQQQKDWGKCSEAWINDNGYCKATCGKCGSGASGASGGSGGSGKGASPPAVQAYSGPPQPPSGRKLLRAVQRPSPQ